MVDDPVTVAIGATVRTRIGALDPGDVGAGVFRVGDAIAIAISRSLRAVPLCIERPAETRHRAEVGRSDGLREPRACAHGCVQPASEAERGHAERLERGVVERRHAARRNGRDRALRHDEDRDLRGRFDADAESIAVGPESGACREHQRGGLPGGGTDVDLGARLESGVCVHVEEPSGERLGEERSLEADVSVGRVSAPAASRCEERHVEREPKRRRGVSLEPADQAHATTEPEIAERGGGR